MRIKEDARVKKTKAKLFASFEELLSEKPFEDITINEVCIKADVRRATFYKHFTDKYNFLAVLTSSLIQQFNDTMREEARKNRIRLTAETYHVEYMKHLMRYLYENRKIVNLIFASNMASTLITILIQENYKNVKTRLNSDVQNGARLVASVDTVATMLAGGIGNALVKWFSEGASSSYDELATELECIIRAMFIA